MNAAKDDDGADAHGANLTEIHPGATRDSQSHNWQKLAARWRTYWANTNAGINYLLSLELPRKDEQLN